MLVLKSVRKRKRARKSTETAAAETAPEAPETAAAPEAPETAAAPEAPETAAAETAAAPAAAPHVRGLLRKSAIRQFLKREYDFPLQIREAFFAAAEAKFSADLRRSVARAREFKRSTLMGPDA
jgi:hypothetical protein